MTAAVPAASAHRGPALRVGNEETRRSLSGHAPLWQTEVLVLRGEDRADLLDRIRVLSEYLAHHPDTNLVDLAFTLNGELMIGGSRLAIVAGSVADVSSRLARARERLADPVCEQIRDTTGIYYFAQPLAREGQVAFLFPGEGAQYPGMLSDVAQAFPEAQQFFDDIDGILTHVREGEPAVSQLFLTRGDASTESALRRLDNAMLSVLMADGAMYRVLERIGLKPACAAGHSMGEMAAISASGSVENDESYLERFGATMKVLNQQEATSDYDCVLLAVGTGKATLTEILAGLGDPPVYLAMDNCHRQTVVVGQSDVMARVQEELQTRGLICERLPFRRPYHTPLFEPMLGPLRDLFGGVFYHPPRFPVYSCTTAEPFPSDSDAIRALAVQHWAAPVRFTQMIENMHAAGVRLFVEVGPRGNLSAFVEDILRGKRFIALPANMPRRSGLTQLNHLIAQLAAHDVELDLISYYAPRSPQLIEALSDHRNGVAPSRDARYEEPVSERLDDQEDGFLPASEHTSSHAQVMHQYLEVMAQFLELQEEMTTAFLMRARRGPSLPAADRVPEQPEADVVRPLRGDIVHLVPGQEVVVRRLLDLAEDRFADDHTVGGRQVSRVDPEQHGVPVMPMTFTLAMLAEASAVLGPGLVVTAIKEIRLLRWLAFDPTELSSVEISARLVEVDPAGEMRISAEVRDLGAVSAEKSNGVRVAQGTVVLSPSYPPAPPAGAFPVTNERPVSMSVEQVYHNLFHGPMFQGVKRTIRGGDEGIEAEVEVLPRDQLFRSAPTPTFQIDPVLLDVVLHPLATWHLHQPDLAGRIMLPVGVDAVRFYGPPATPGTRFHSRAWVSEANLRSFSHTGETIAMDGTVYIALEGVKCWRFYVPFGEVNFHGPKDQYFLARRWNEIEAQADRAIPFAIVRLDVPPDLKQPAMNRVTAQVTLTPTEQRDLRGRLREKDDPHRWLFDRIAAKDAIRLVWHDRTGERLFPADIECQEQQGLYTAHRRASEDDRFDGAVVTSADGITVGLSTTAPVFGLAVARLDDQAIDEVKARCTGEAIASAKALLARHEDEENNSSAQDWHVYTAREGDYLVAWTLGERPSP
jgi:malonyl CoA-acyl carrier protein transacylase